jgi:hypothetical protein
VGEWRGKPVARVGELQSRNLAVGQTRVGARVLGIWIDIVRTTLGRPRVPVGGALGHVEDGAARRVVVDDPIGKTIERVALADELTSDRIDFGQRHPVGRRPLVDAYQLRRQHQRRQADDRHIQGDAVVVGGIALRDSESLAAALRGADVVVEARAAAVDALHDDHCRIVRLLHLLVAEVRDRFLVKPPVVRSRTDRERPAAAAPGSERYLVSGIAAVGGKAARDQRRARRSAAGEIRHDAVVPAAPDLGGATTPRCR